MGLVKGTVVRSDERQVRYGSGYASRGSLGFIMMATDLVVDENVNRLAPPGVLVSVTRVPSSNEIVADKLAEQLGMLADAASRIQPDAPPDLICYACTSGSIIMGEDRVAAEIVRGAPRSSPMTLVSGVVDALHAVGAQRIVVGTPYVDEINTIELDYLIDLGFVVLDIQGLNISDGVPMGKIAPEFIKEFALSIDRPDADTIFLSCSAIPSLDVIAEIEAAVNKPVICSNQAMMWSCLRRIGVSDHIEGYGRLFSHPAPQRLRAPWEATARQGAVFGSLAVVG